MSLAVGAKAPPFVTVDFSGRRVDTASLRGQPVLISFYRYASCPLCNLRMRALMLAYADLHARGLQFIAVFQSSAAAIGQYLARHEAPFPIIADPERALYRAFHVESRWSAMLSLGAVGKALSAARHGFLPGAIDGDLHARPADFLIDENGNVVLAHYGKRIDDHVPLDEVRDWLAAARPARQA